MTQVPMKGSLAASATPSSPAIDTATTTSIASLASAARRTQSPTRRTELLTGHTE
jgi:hypothetical protein